MKIKISTANSPEKTKSFQILGNEAWLDRLYSYYPSSKEESTQLEACFDFTQKETFCFIKGSLTFKNEANLEIVSRLNTLNRNVLQEKSVDNVLTAIENSKTMSFQRVLFALGIKDIGETVAKTVASFAEDIDTLIYDSKDKLVNKRFIYYDRKKNVNNNWKKCEKELLKKKIYIKHKNKFNIPIFSMNTKKAIDCILQNLKKNENFLID